MPMWILGVVCLALFGWWSAVSSLLQYTMLQTQTPEAMLGRINGLWTAQNVTGDAIGAALLGGLGDDDTGCFRKRERFWFVDYRRVVIAGAGGAATFSPDAAADDSVRQLMLKQRLKSFQHLHGAVVIQANVSVPQRINLLVFVLQAGARAVDWHKSHRHLSDRSEQE